MAWRLLLLLAALAPAALGQTVGFAAAYLDVGKPVNVSEAAGTAYVLVELSAAQGAAVTVDVAVSPSVTDPATAGADYTDPGTLTLTFPSGSTAQNATVAILDDALFEAPDERLELSLSNPSAGLTVDAAADTAYLRISDDHDAGVLRFASASVQVAEDAGTLTLTVTRELGSSGEVRVDYEDTGAGSAVPGAHYSTLRTREAGTPDSEASLNTITFADGETEQTFDVDIVDDDHYDFGTVYDAADPSQILSTSALSFVVRLTNSQPYEAAALELSDVWSNGNLSYGLGAEAATQIVILDDGDAGTVAFTDATFYVREDQLSYDVTLTRTGGSSTSLFVDATVDVLVGAAGNATRDDDFTYCSDCTVFFENGVTEQTVTVGIVNDADYEAPDEHVQLYITAPEGGLSVGAQSSADLVIVDDRDAGTFSFSKVEFTMFEGSAQGSVTVTRSGLDIATDTHASAANSYASGEVTVDISTWGGAATDYGVAADAGCSDFVPCWATPDADYSSVDNVTLTFADGETSQTFQVAMLGDDIFESPDEVFRVVLSNSQGGAHVGFDAAHPDLWDDDINGALEPDPDGVPDYVTGVVTIIDNTDPAVVMMRASTAVAESTVVDGYALYLNGQPDADVTVSVSLDEGNWTADLTVAPTSLTFTDINWGSPQTIVVSAVNDSYAESSEVHAIYHTVSSSDPYYQSEGTAARYEDGDSGVAWGRGIYRDNEFYGFKWSSADAVIAAPNPAVHYVTIRDNDYTGATIEVDADRFDARSGAPKATLAVRDDGATAWYTVTKLSDFDAELTVTPSDACLTVDQQQDDNQTFVVSAAGCGDQTLTISHALSDGSPVLPDPLTVRTFSAAEVQLLDTAVEPVENGVNDSYVLQLGAEPMHADWELADDEGDLWSLDLAPAFQATLRELYPTEQFLSSLAVANNGSESDGFWGDRKLAHLSFALPADPLAALGAPRTGLALLRLFRTAGGENEGLGGVFVGAAVINGTASRWNESDPGLAPDTVAPVALAGSYSDSLNEFVEAADVWIELDLTEHVNAALDRGAAAFDVQLSALTVADWLVDLTDEVTFDPSAVQLRLRASGAARLTEGATASQSTSDADSDAAFALDGDEQTYAMTLTAETNPWWHVDLGAVRPVSHVRVRVRAIFAEGYDHADLWLVLGRDASLAGAHLSSEPGDVRHLFAIDRDPVSQVGYHETIELLYAAADEVPQYDADDFESGHFAALSQPTRYVLLRCDGAASLQLAEVEVLQAAPAATTVSAAAYLPSPSSLSLYNQVALWPSQECNALGQCRTVLTFTAGNWADPQFVYVSAVDDDVASGDRILGVTHETGGDADFDAAFSPRSTVQVEILEDDAVGVTVSAADVSVVEGAHVIAGAPEYQTEVEAEPSSCAGSNGGGAGCLWLSTTLLDAPDFSGGYAWLRVRFAEPTEVVQLDLYKAADTGERGVKAFTVKAAPYVSTTASTYSTVSSHSVPWGSTSFGAWHSYAIEGFDAAVMLIVVDEVYSVPGHASSRVDIAAVRLTQRAALEYPDMPVDATGLSRTHAFGETAEYEVVLDSEPVADVVVELAGLAGGGGVALWAANNKSLGHEERETTAVYHDGTVWSVQQPALVFNASSWSTPQRVLVTAVDDNEQEGDRELVLQHSVVSADGAEMIEGNSLTADEVGLEASPLSGSLSYNDIPVDDVDAAITEDDRAGVSLDRSTVEAAEGADFEHFSVLLDCKPTAAVTITVSGSDAAQISVTPSALTFSEDTWHVPQTVAITATDDADFEGAQSMRSTYSPLIAQAATELVSLAVASADARFDGSELGENEEDGDAVLYVARQGVVVTVVDDDGGCDAEYTCANGGQCDAASFRCACPDGFGGHDCGRDCRVAGAGSCQFERVFLLAAIAEEDFDAQSWMAALADAVGVGGSPEALYAADARAHGCMFSSRAACTAVEVDVVDLLAEGLTQTLLDAEVDGQLAGAPLYVQYSVQLDTTDPVLTANYLAWTLAGGFLAAVLAVILWRFAAVRNRVLGAWGCLYSAVWRSEADEIEEREALAKAAKEQAERERAEAEEAERIANAKVVRGTAQGPGLRGGGASFRG